MSLYLSKELYWGVLLVWIGGMISAEAADSPLKPIPLTKDSNQHTYLGGWLEQQLQDMTKSCINGPLAVQQPTTIAGYISGYNPVLVSAVSNPIRSAFAIDVMPFPTVLEQADGSLSRIFGYVFTDDDIRSENRNANRYLDVDYANEADQIASPGLPSATFTATCSSVMRDALASSGGLSFGVASLQAGMSADYDSQTAYALNLVRGHFNSPVVAMWRGQTMDAVATSPGMLFSSMMFWDWLATFNPPAATKLSLMEFFDGVALYKRFGLKQQTQFNASAHAGIQTIGINISGDAAVALRGQTDLNLQSFKTAAYFQNATALIRGFFPFPSADEIASKAHENANFAVQTDQNVPLFVSDLNQQRFRESLLGLPNKFCVKAAWTPSVSSVGLESAAVVEINKQRVCLFDFTYQPALADLAKDTITVAFDLQSTRRTSGKTLSLPVTPITFNTTTLPRVDYLGGSPDPSPTQAVGGANMVTYSWRFTYNLTDNGITRNASDINIAGTKPVVMKCIPGAVFPAYPRLDLTLQPGTPGNARILWIDATVTLQRAAPSTDKPSPLACHLEGQMEIFAGVGKPLSHRDLPPTPLNYPTAP